MTCNIALNGFFGRMGQSIFEESKKNSNCLITVGCDLKEKLLNNTFENIALTSDIEKHSEDFDVVIDFTLPEPSIDLIKKCVRINKPIAIGTTGFSQEQLSLIFEASKEIPILLAPNMSHGVNVSFAALEDISKSLKIVLLGDTDQVDTPYIDSRSNGLTVTIEKFKDHLLAGHIKLVKGQRSEIATAASNIL